ncbi:MAG: GspJ family type II secretion system protein [Oligoflexia bacterium]|nr:GspJ family type II secretion system protein [Oligoflexia bacterium]
MDFRRLNQRGLTLIEVMIAVVIIAIMSALTSVSIQKSTRYKKKIEQDLDDYAGVRDTLIIMTRDINQAFHWHDVTEIIKNKMINEAKQAGKPPPFQTRPDNQPTPIPTEKLTAFIGESDSLYFTSLNNARVTTNSPQSDQAKIGYYIKSVKSAANGEPTKALIRRVSPVLDEDVTRGGKESVILEGIKEFKLRYYGGKDEREWQPSWKSVDTSDSRTLYMFPDAVEISITITKEKREISLSTVAAIHMPNNDPFKMTTSSPAPGVSQ